MPSLKPITPEPQIAKIYELLSAHWGEQHWWPAQSRFEVIVGTFLTQNTSWSNVETAIRRLRRARALSPAAIRQIPIGKLEELIRSSGYFRQKALRLKNFVAFLDARYGGSLTRMFSQETPVLREELLALNGIGPETADSILLYAGQHAIFVVDSYTRRIAARHGLIGENTSYEDIRTLFEAGLKRVAAAPLTAEANRSGGAAHSPSRMSRAQRNQAAQVFNETHALIVGIGKTFCLKSNALCGQCPLQPLLPGNR